MIKIAEESQGRWTQARMYWEMAWRAHSGEGFQMVSLPRKVQGSHGLQLLTCRKVGGQASCWQAHRPSSQQKGTSENRTCFMPQGLRSGESHSPRLSPSVPCRIMEVPGTCTTSK